MVHYRAVPVIFSGFPLALISTCRGIMSVKMGHWSNQPNPTYNMLHAYHEHLLIGYYDDNDRQGFLTKKAVESCMLQLLFSCRQGTSHLYIGCIDACVGLPDVWVDERCSKIVILIECSSVRLGDILDLAVVVVHNWPRWVDFIG